MMDILCCIHSFTRNRIADLRSSFSSSRRLRCEKVDELNVFYSLRPMFITLACMGSCPPQIIAKTKQGRALYWIWHAIIAFLLNMFTFGYFLRVLMMIGSSKFWDGALALLRLVTATFYFDVFRYRWKRYIQLLRDIDFALERYRSPRLRMNFYLPVVIGWTYVTVATIMAYMEVAAESGHIHQYIKRHFFGLTFPNTTHPLITHSIVASDIIAKSIIIRLNISFGIVIFLCTCYVVTRRFEVFNAVLETLVKNASMVTVDAIDSLRDVHDKLRRISENVDGIFRYIVLLWFTMAVFVSCSEVTNIVTGGFHAANIYGFISFGLHLLFIFTAIGSISMFGALLTEQAKRSLPIVYEISTVVPITSMTVMKQVDLLRLQLTTPLIGITAGNFFVLTRGVLLTAFSVIVSYVILVIQMSPKE